MQARCREEQRRIDTLCGYALACYLAVSATWVCLLVLPGLALFGFLMAAIAGVFGLLRGLLMPFRFWIVQAITLVYLGVAFTYYSIKSTAMPLELIGVGMLYTAALSYNIFRIMRHDFARTVPDWRCENCGYALVGLSQNKCPECGLKFDPDRVPLIGKSGKSGKTPSDSDAPKPSQAIE